MCSLFILLVEDVKELCGQSLCSLPTVVLSLAPNKHGAMGIVEWQVVGLRTRGGVANVSWTEKGRKKASRGIFLNWAGGGREREVHRFVCV